MPHRNLNGCRVLIIEDEYFLANDLERALSAHGAKVVGPIAEGSEAIAQVMRREFDVAVVDINLRNELAYPIVDELVRQRIPFGLATGYSTDALPHRFRAAKRWEKPYDIPVIIEDVAVLAAGLKYGES